MLMVCPPSAAVDVGFGMKGDGDARSCHSCPLTRSRRWSPAWGLSLLFFSLLVWLVPSPARGESPAPSVHWGSTAFPDQYTTVTSGLTLNRFTPIDGLGNKYDSTVGNTLGFNLITLSWTKHWDYSGTSWDDRIERYMRLFEKDDVKKLQTGVKCFIEKDEWQLLP
ncbi:MAG: hypothetical protein HP495_04760 [Nitrospira sp.]|nr:hypothetical protein [Nitrospira sp.]